MDRTDAQAAARALKASGRLEGATGLYGSKAYRELIERRIEGADDADLDDLVDDLVSEAAATEATQMATAVALSDAVDNRLSAEGPPEDDAAADRGPTSRIEEGDGVARSPRRAPHLGWG